MEFSARSFLMAGVATVTGSAVAFAPSVQPPPPPEPTIQLTAAVQPLTQQQDLLSILLTSPERLLGPAVTPGTITSPPAPLAIPIAPNLADTIDNTYLAVEPWVRYGFQVAADVLGWVPFVGWLSGQIMVFYNFFESKIQSAVFNFTDWLRGQGGVIENVVDFGVDVFWSFVYLGIDEWNYFLPPLPPLPIPPRPPLNQFAALNTLVGPATTPPVEVTNAASDFVTNALVGANESFFDAVAAVTEFGLFDVAEPVLGSIGLGFINDEININYNVLKRLATEQVGFVSDLMTGPDRFRHDVLESVQGPLQALGTEAGFVADRAITRGGNAIDAVVDYGRDQLTFVTGVAAPQGAPATAGVSSVPASVRLALKNVGAGQPSAPDAVAPVGEDVNVTVEAAAPTTAQTAKDATPIASSVAAARRAVERDVVRGQGEVAGAVSTAASDDTEAAGSENADKTGDADKTGEAVAKALRSVAKGGQGGAREAADGVKKSAEGVKKVTDDVKKTVNGVKKAADDVHKAVKASRQANTDDKTGNEG